MQVERTDTLIPLTLGVYDTSGPVTGLSTVVAIRDTASGDYLDFSDLTFRPVPITRQAALTELGNGFYNRNLDLTTITNLTTTTKHLGIEYEILTAGQEAVEDDFLTIREAHYDLPTAIFNKIIDGTVTLGILFKRLNSYIRGKIVLDIISAAPDTDVEYFAEDSTTKLFESRKSPTTRLPQ